LLDAPCSATGTFRRHPEVLYRARPQVIAGSAEQQARLLERAAAWLSPGGALVYSVCSLEYEEGGAIVTAFLAARPDFRLDRPSDGPGDLPAFAALDPAGRLRILPGLIEDQGGLDGFFAARLVRTAG
ncbi:MAG: SAM-dependent methyltransferase, partial [Sphingomicrobium sp.]